MHVSPRTLASLGFPELVTALSTRCRTDLGRERAAARTFLDHVDEVAQSLRLIDEARSLRAEPLTLAIDGVTDVRSFVDRAQKGAMLEPAQLIAICRVLFACERSHEILDERVARLPGLGTIGQRLPVLTRLATTLDRAFEANGEIADRASADLKSARDVARGLHRRIRGRLDELLRDERFGTNLRESYYSVRDGRYVVPVMSSHQREVPGIVHNASGTGQTLFVEPTELITLGNELAIAQSVVLEEERKVLIDLSDRVGREAERINAGVEALATLDELEACALLANDLRATTPTLTASSHALRLRGLRHPRLVLKDAASVIANDVEFTTDARTLVISGPNAGGKTVTLTGTGLCALMTRLGLPIPVDEGSTMPLFSQVHAAIGDQQDLQSGLSTFSAHVSMLRDVAKEVSAGALVVIDEIAADTDPREGAAIATAVLEFLNERQALVLVTTHLEELKALAHLDPRFVNARVGFDARAMTPTYRLQMGFAGASSAIDMARRVGLDSAICERAADLSANAGGALSKALHATEEERRKLGEARDEAQRALAEAQARARALETSLAEAKTQRAAEELRFREALKGELEFARQQLRGLIESLEKNKSLKAAVAASAELTSRINEQISAERQTKATLTAEPSTPTALELRIGARARHTGLDTDVEILELHGDAAVVTAGAMKMRVATSLLAPPRRGQAPVASAPASSKNDRLQRAEAASAKVMTMASPTLDLRGQRADDALRQVEQFLDRAARAGEQAAIIIHGHGTGALKLAVRDYLSASPYARSSRPGDGSEGGDGATVVVLA